MRADDRQRRHREAGVVDHWDVSADGTVYTFPPAAERYLHDGTKSISRSSLERAVAPDSKNAQIAAVRPIAKIERIR